MDLRLRGSVKTSETWASLYVGLAKVLDLRHVPDRGFRLRAHETLTTPKNRWESSWDRKWWKEDALAAKWDDVDLYLERVIPSVEKRSLVEGALQSAISVFANEEMLPIDREAALVYTNQAEKDLIKRQLERPLLNAVGVPGKGRWWNSIPETLGGECDVLAINKEGMLLAIEVKPRTSTSTIRWAPLQARHYANLFSEWIHGERGVGQDTAKVVLDKMVNQRLDLGLITDARYVSLPIRVQPVIAVGRGFSSAAIHGLNEVQERLELAGKNDPPLLIRQATLWGELE